MLAGIYAGIDAKGRAALASRQYFADTPPREGEARWGLSAVLRPTSWNTALRDCADEIAALIGERGFIYGPGDSTSP